MWLFRATGNESYLDILSSGNNGGVRSKFFGVQLLVSKNDNPWAAYKENVDMFVCSVMQKAGDTNVRMSPGGMLWFQPWGKNPEHHLLHAGPLRLRRLPRSGRSHPGMPRWQRRP
ncbi:unnamed protein product [Musa acuminata subsp. burmannicoides]